MIHNKKHIGLILLGGALAALILLSASLSNLQLHAGTPFPGSGNSDSEPQNFADPSLEDGSFFPTPKGIFILSFLILMIYVSGRLIALVNRRRIFQLLLTVIGLAVIVIVVSRIITPGHPASLPNESSGIASPPTFDYPVSPLGKPPQEFVWFVIIGLASIATLVAIKLLKAGLSSPRIEEQLSQEAEMAVNAIQAGGDLRNVIIRCYLQMSWALQEEQGIKRRYDMTVREFESWLESKGFPNVPVHQLSNLFEKVRYSIQSVTKDDEMLAVESLNEIIEFCRGGMEKGDE